MRATTDGFDEVVRDSHVRAVVVESWRGGEQLADDVPVADGDLEVDDDSAVPGSLTITVPAGTDREWDPTGDPFHPLAPFGQRLYLAAGITYHNGTTELLPCGWYLITDAEPDPLGTGIRVKAASLERLLEDDRIMSPLSPLAAGTLYSEAARLCGGKIPFDDLPAGLVDRAVPSDLTWEESRLAALGRIGTAWPARFRVDDAGLMQALLPIPDTLGPSVLTLATGSRGVVAEWSTSTSREDVWNLVFARGEEDTADKRQVFGSAYDNDPASPTYIYGPFGRKAFELSSPLLTTYAQCEKAAATRLKRLQRRTRRATVSMVPDPRIQLDDVVTLDTPTVKGDGRVAAIKLPLVPEGGPMGLVIEVEPA